MKCTKCKEEKTITNSHFSLCRKCNDERLEERKDKKVHKHTTLDKNTLKPNENKVKSKTKRSLSSPDFSKEEKKPDLIKLDELFYEECFNLSDHKCEECGVNLPEIFRDLDGKIVAR